MNRNLPRWIFASVTKFVADALADIPQSAFLHVDGQPDETTTKSEWYELYVQGPSSVEQSNRYFRHDVDILIGCIVRSPAANVHRLPQIKGDMINVLNNCIPVYKYGDGPEDDETEQVGFLELRNDTPRPIDGIDFGIVSHRDVEVRRATVEGQYRMYLKETSS